MKKSLIAVALLALAAFAFANGNAQAAAPAAGGKVVIGALIRNLDEQFVRDYADNLQKIAAAKGVDLKLLDARNDQANQLDQLNTLLSQGVKYFVIVATQTEVTEQMAKAIQAKGGGAAFSNIQPSVAALKVGPNFFLASSPESVAGSIQADIIDDYFKKNPAKLAPGKTINAVMLLGQLGHPAQKYRTDAVLAGLRAKGYTVNIIAQDTANWKPDEAQQKMDAWIAAYKGKFNIVITNNDGMALGAVESLLTNKMVDDPANPTKDVDGDGTVLLVPVLGVDATQVALKSMQENKLLATVLQDSVGQSATAFDLAYTMATKGTAIGSVAWGLKALTAPTDESPANDAAIVAQCYLVPFKAVTKANYLDFMTK
jgi:methyl-galactoside transport system substrate-binding protein